MKEEKQQLTIKDFILMVKDWSRYFLGYWKLICIAGFLGGALGVVLAIFDKPIYIAELTLALEDKNAGNPMAGIASQFGVELGGANSGGAFSGENNIELLKSRALIEKALLTPVLIDGREDLLVNRYIEFNKMREKWADDPYLNDVVYTIGEPREKFGIKKDSVLFQIYKTVKKKSLNVSRLDKKLTIIKIEVRSNDELFAKLFTEVIVETASRFYVETKTKRSKSNLDIIEARLDSVRRELDKGIHGAAVSKDQNMLTIRAAGNIQSARKTLNVQVLTTMYTELIKNSEMAKYALLRDEPLVQIIDTPILPLERKKKGKTMGLIGGGFVGGTLSLLFLWARRGWRTIMDES